MENYRDVLEKILEKKKKSTPNQAETKEYTEIISKLLMQEGFTDEAERYLYDGFVICGAEPLKKFICASPEPKKALAAFFNGKKYGERVDATAPIVFSLFALLLNEQGKNIDLLVKVFQKVPYVVMNKEGVLAQRAYQMFKSKCLAIVKADVLPPASKLDEYDLQPGYIRAFNDFIAGVEKQTDLTKEDLSYQKKFIAFKAWFAMPESAEKNAAKTDAAKETEHVKKTVEVQQVPAHAENIDNSDNTEKNSHENKINNGQPAEKKIFEKQGAEKKNQQGKMQVNAQKQAQQGKQQVNAQKQAQQGKPQADAQKQNQQGKPQADAKKQGQHDKPQANVKKQENTAVNVAAKNAQSDAKQKKTPEEIIEEQNSELKTLHEMCDNLERENNQLKYDKNLAGITISKKDEIIEKLKADLAEERNRALGLSAALERERENQAEQNKLVEVMKTELQKKPAEFLNNLRSKLRIEYLDFQDAVDMEMSIDLGENMREQLRSVFNICIKAGMKFD